MMWNGSVKVVRTYLFLYSEISREHTLAGWLSRMMLMPRQLVGVHSTSFIHIYPSGSP